MEERVEEGKKQFIKQVAGDVRAEKYSEMKRRFGEGGCGG